MAWTGLDRRPQKTLIRHFDCVYFSFFFPQVIGNGSFGVVYQAKLCETGEMVAIKKVLQDKRFKNRELQIMRRLEHCNIVKVRRFSVFSPLKVGFMKSVAVFFCFARQSLSGLWYKTNFYQPRNSMVKGWVKTFAGGGSDN